MYLISIHKASLHDVNSVFFFLGGNVLPVRAFGGFSVDNSKAFSMFFSQVMWLQLRLQHWFSVSHSAILSKFFGLTFQDLFLFTGGWLVFQRCYRFLFHLGMCQMQYLISFRRLFVCGGQFGIWLEWWG